MILAISSLCMLSPGARRGFVRARSPQRKSVKADVNSQQGPIHQDSTQNLLPLSCHQYSFPVFASASRNFDQPRGSVSKKYFTRHHQYSSEDPYTGCLVQPCSQRSSYISSVLTASSASSSNSSILTVLCALFASARIASNFNSAISLLSICPTSQRVCPFPPPLLLNCGGILLEPKSQNAYRFDLWCAWQSSIVYSKWHDEGH